MTIVAFGTSAPELGVNITAALENRGSISFGNIIGSSIANIALILGIAALIMPLKVRSSTLARELPIMLVATALLIPLSLEGVLGRMDGVILLSAFVAFLIFAIFSALSSRSENSLLPSAEDVEAKGASPAVALLMTALGIAGVLFGSDWTVEGAVGIAQIIGVEDAIIGFTVVAIGTSLPELATSLMAVRAGEGDLALGNVVGSNVFNILFVLGVTTIMSPITIPSAGFVDLAALMVISVALWLAGATHGRQIVGWEGGVMVASYVGYVTWRVFFCTL